MHPHVPIIATALGAIVWLWLMHNRSLPLEGCCWPAAATAALLYYALVVAPAWYWACPEMLPVWQIRLLAWIVVFLWALIAHANEYTAPLLIIVAAVFIFLIDAGHVEHLEAVQLAFGLLAWHVLLEQ